MEFVRRPLKALTAIFCLSAALILTAAPVHAEKRIALVIGNDRYPNLPPDRQLLKAVNDADAVGDTLASLGFEVIRGRNLSWQGMIDKLSEFTARLAVGDTAAFFYAGHGVAIGGVNYFIPSDVPTVTEGAESRVRGASISEPDLIAEIQSKNPRVAFLALDACRDNPFPRSGTRTIGNTRGLADAKPARGVFTIYSAGIGQTALDRMERNDPNRNSVFTRVFINLLAKQGIDLAGMAIEVREQVAELALKAKNDRDEPDPHEQTPAYYDQTIGGRIFLAGRTIGVEKKKQVPAVSAADDIAWGIVQSTTDITALQRFIAQFPTSAHKVEAETRIASLERKAALRAQAADEQRTQAQSRAEQESQKLVVVTPPVAPPAPPHSRVDEITLSHYSPLRGATVATLSPGLAEKLGIKQSYEGAVILDVASGSRAQEIGFRKGDLVVELNGKVIKSSADLDLITKDKVGIWPITVIRDDLEVKATLFSR